MNVLKRLEELFKDSAKADHEQKLAAANVVRPPLLIAHYHVKVNMSTFISY